MVPALAAQVHRSPRDLVLDHAQVDPQAMQIDLERAGTLSERTAPSISASRA